MLARGRCCVTPNPPNPPTPQPPARPWRWISPAKLSAMRSGPISNNALPCFKTTRCIRIIPAAPAKVVVQGSAAFHCPDDIDQRIDPDGDGSVPIKPAVVLSRHRELWAQLRVGPDGAPLGRRRHVLFQRHQPQPVEAEDPQGIPNHPAGHPRASSTVRIVWDFDPVHAPPGIVGERNFLYCDGHIDY